MTAPGIDVDTEALVADPGALLGDVHHPVLEVRGLVVSFGGFKAIDGVDFTVNKGESASSSARTAPARPR
jgi:hypothetical protein